MAYNYVKPGNVITVTSPTGGVSSNDPVLIRTLFGVATHDAAEGAALELATEGVFTLPADNNLQIDVGDRLFWDATNSWVDKTATAQVCVGVAVPLDTLSDVAKATAGTTVRVRLGANTAAGT